ncbi:caspase family protein [Aestuariivirga sp.]|uniref:caspase family protein n=1 Tax=Aestuariivirga sp. TaxID=2650926 RepID=UPI0039E595B8
MRALAFRRFVAALLAVLLLAAPGFADAPKPLKGVALVIGESKYRELPVLANPANDAAAMARLFGDLGFAVTSVTDRDVKRLKRDLANFADDAAGADMAVIYYSGHGIEAGGENWLVPVDTSRGGILDAQEALVPLSDVMDQLKSTVPLTLLFLDACRSDPFPPQTQLRKGGAVLPGLAGGMGLGKGVTDAGNAPAAEGLGTVIAFAAEPGHTALDGPPDGNSPYAAALLRHLGASTGAEFGTVMRMVTEEVYLKTEGQQRPWMNETLTRLLYFGAPQSAPWGDDGAILSERRQVLLTIASLDDGTRKQVEQAAKMDGVPMDALYGLLHALGAEAPKDPAQLAEVLKLQAATIQKRLAAAQALTGQDAEVARLTALADKALADGAVLANVRYMEEADARQKAADAALDTAEQNLKDRRIASAETKEKLGQAYELNFQFPQAATSYAEAFAQVEKWDAKLARHYKRLEGDALSQYGEYGGNRAALDGAVAAYQTALELVPRESDPSKWAELQNNLGIAYEVIGQREAGTENLERAIEAYQAALDDNTRARDPSLWATTHNNLGDVLQILGGRQQGTAALENAVSAYDAALEVHTREANPLKWAMVQANRASVLQTLGERRGGTDELSQALAGDVAALGVYTREADPLAWARVQTNRGNALRVIAGRENNAEMMQQAVEASRLALSVQSREKVPLQWALSQNNLGIALGKLAEMTGDPRSYPDAITALRNALLERRRERVPLDWAATQNNLGNMQTRFALYDPGGNHLAEAVTAYSAALEVWTREAAPLDWASTQNNLGNAYQVLGKAEAGAGIPEGIDALNNALAAYRAALEIRTRQADPLGWANTQNNMGWTLKYLGEATKNAKRIREGRAAVLAAWNTFKALGYRNMDASFERGLMAFDESLKKLGR